MKAFTTICACVAVSALTLTPCFAECPDSTGSVKADTQQGISKDGTHAPLENSASTQTQTGAASTGTTTTSGDANSQPQKKGETMPMAADKNLATSGQDAVAQQKGEQTAAAKAKDAKDCIE